MCGSNVPRPPASFGSSAYFPGGFNLKTTAYSATRINKGVNNRHNMMESVSPFSPDAVRLYLTLFHRHPACAQIEPQKPPLIFRQGFRVLCQRRTLIGQEGRTSQRSCGPACVGCPSVQDRCLAVQAQSKQPSSPGEVKPRLKRALSINLNEPEPSNAEPGKEEYPGSPVRRWKTSSNISRRQGTSSR